MERFGIAHQKPMNANSRVTPEERDFVESYGGGNVSLGVRSLIREEMARQRKGSVRSERSPLASRLLDLLDEAAKRVFLADEDHHIEIEEAYSILRPITRASDKLTHLSEAS